MKSWFFTLIVLVSISCEKEDDTSTDWAIAKETISNCISMSITDSTAIVQNLIGSWKQVAIGCGECFDQPKLEYKLVEFKSNNTGTLTTTDSETLFSWTIGRLIPMTSLSIKTNPEFFDIQGDIFCEEYFILNNAPRDGTTVIWQRK